ncbi:LysR substrate-binding domain-containing protein [Falsiroseomonas frigidaquae]|uniref:LysR substrate-binding domain-containing protein n=1 Tax=Falsiroseomonas frigidaquae TaxID=487318 RepID=UPI00315820E5
MPTPDGGAYYAECTRLLAELEDAESAFSGSRPRGRLHVDAHGTLARRFIVPRLPAFLEAYPEIELFMSDGDRYVDLLREGVDCVVRAGTLTDSDMISRRVTELEEITCASSAYLARHGVPRGLDDFEGHRMVGFRSSASGSVLPLEFTVGQAVREVKLPCALTVGGAETYAAAAIAGFGLIQAPRYRFESELASGQLQIVLPQHPPVPLPISVLYPRARHLAPRVRVFIDWLAEVFRDVR